MSKPAPELLSEEEAATLLNLTKEVFSDLQQQDEAGLLNPPLPARKAGFYSSFALLGWKTLNSIWRKKLQ